MTMLLNINLYVHQQSRLIEGMLCPHNVLYRDALYHPVTLQNLSSGQGKIHLLLSETHRKLYVSTSSVPTFLQEKLRQKFSSCGQLKLQSCQCKNILTFPLVLEQRHNGRAHLTSKASYFDDSYAILNTLMNKKRYGRNIRVRLR